MTDKRKPLGARITSAIKGDTPGVDPDVIRDLAKLLEETGLTEIEVERGGVRVRVARNAIQTVSVPAPAPVFHAQPAPQKEPPKEQPAEPQTKRGTVVNSPMVGTVYLSPEPGATPFVKIGDAVEDGTLCIIEAMKTMNPVASPTPGRVAEIYVRDGQPVEFGEPLMLIV